MHPPENEDSSSAEFDQVLMGIFLKELSNQATSLRQYAASLHEKPHDAPCLDKFLKTLREIIQGAKIIRFDAFVTTGKMLEHYMAALKEGRISWDQAGEECLQRIIDFLIELSRITPSKFEHFLQAKRDFLKESGNQLQQLEKTKEPVPQELRQAQRNIPPSSSEFFFDAKMVELFRAELEMQSKTLSQGLIDLEKMPEDATVLDTLMRAAHSIKGAARVIALNPLVRLAHAMEDCFVAAQHEQIEIHEEQVDLLLKCIDLLGQLSKVKPEAINAWAAESQPEIDHLIQELSASLQKKPPAEKAALKHAAQEPEASPYLKPSDVQRIIEKVKPFKTSYARDRVLRITAENLNRLMGLAGESLVETRWLYPFEENLQKFKSKFKKIGTTLDVLRDNLRGEILNEAAQHCLTDLHDQVHGVQALFSEHLGELDNFIVRYSALSDRLYQEVVNSRMRPFADGVEAFPRLVRDLGRQLGKQVNLEIVGLSTQVDRDILEKLESPLSHLLRNAVDHGIETPEERKAAGKPPQGVVVLEARHQGGMLAITVSDDGKGIDIEELRRTIVEKKYLAEDVAKRLTAGEVIDFLFLPGFSTSARVSEISGRGVGLDIVQSVVQEVGGGVRISYKPGKGTSFHLQLPVTLSVIHAILVEISGEAYAFPLTRIDQTVLLAKEKIEMIENRQFFRHEDQNIGLVSAWQVLELEEPRLSFNHLPVIIVSDSLNCYGLVVDRLIGEKELVVQELDARLGKVPNVIATSVLEDGSPVLIIDVDDIVRSTDNLLSGGRLTKLANLKQGASAQARKRVLVVDDSLTVREVECRLLKNKGYEVETAVNGIDGLNAVRAGRYDLVISDVDMPRMNGIELLKTIKSDPKLRHLPVMIVSYKSTDEDRMKGLEAGADYYLTKSSFHDTTLIDAVIDLIGKPEV